MDLAHGKEPISWECARTYTDTVAAGWGTTTTYIIIGHTLVGGGTFGVFPLPRLMGLGCQEARAGILAMGCLVVYVFLIGYGYSIPGCNLVWLCPAPCSYYTHMVRGLVSRYIKICPMACTTFVQVVIASHSNSYMESYSNLF